MSPEHILLWLRLGVKYKARKKGVKEFTVTEAFQEEKMDCYLEAPEKRGRWGLAGKVDGYGWVWILLSQP